ncbi:fumarylacetoacetate hydrolase family protein [soil metagenome]
MKLVTFEKDGREGFGAVSGDRVIDLTGRVAGSDSLAALLEADGLAAARAFCEGPPGDFALTDCVLLPVVPRPSKIICLGLNFKGHVTETGRPMPARPVIFHRHAQTLTAHDAALIRPVVSEQLDYEGELCVVIGKRGGNIAPDDAMAYVAGYTCFNEASIRDWQKHSHLYGMGKNFRGTGAVGPWMVTADEIPDPARLVLTTTLNGSEVQRAGIDDFIFPIPELISYVSQALDWLPGDLLVTGTPSGVGLFQNPPRFLRPGDVVEVSITEIGTLRNTVVDQQP